MADQLAPHSTGAYGHPLVRTPAMDALVERGARFDAAELPASVPTLAHYLRLAGYRTTLSGKMHFVGPDQLHGFDERLTTDIYPADFAWTPNWDAPEERIDKWYHNMDSLSEAGQALATYQIDYDEEVGFAAVRHLYHLARDPDRRPFFLAVSFIHPTTPTWPAPSGGTSTTTTTSTSPTFRRSNRSTPTPSASAAGSRPTPSATPRTSAATPGTPTTPTPATSTRGWVTGGPGSRCPATSDLRVFRRSTLGNFGDRHH